MSAATPPAPPRRWSPLLVVHAAVVAAVVLVVALLPPERFEGLVSVALGLATLLGLPWSVALTFVPLAAAPAWVFTAALLAPAILNAAVHAGLLRLVRTRRRQAAMAAPVSGAPVTDPARRRRAVLLLLAGSAVVGAAAWAAWLGWDTSYYTVPGREGLHGPHRPAQVVGCALTVGLATALLAWRHNPVVAAGGVTLGFWLAWTAWWLFGPLGDPMALFGSVFLLCGLVAGTSVSAAVGYGVRVLRRGGGARPSPREPVTTS